MFSKGFSVIDVRDPKNPRGVNYIAAPENTWNIHLQTFGDLLLVINAKDMFAASEFADEKAYYTTSVGKTVGIDEVGKRARDWTAGMAVYDIKNPAEPRQIGFMPVAGGGIHRIWYTGGRYAYASALLDGYSDYIFITIDMSDPANPTEAGRWWIPGMHTAGGESPDWAAGRRFGLHHAIISGDTAYAAWRDAGMVILDVADRSAPKLVKHLNWSPPYGGGTHNCLPLPERELLVVLDEAVLDHQEDGVKHIWVFNNAVRDNPVSIATFPQPDEADYKAKGGHFGPHNLYENRPDGLVSENLIFTTYQNAGIRVFDIADPYRPVETAAYVPGEPERLVDHRPNRTKVIQSCDVFVDRNGLVYANDYNGGLSILEYNG
ncbi:MAG: LVIVD repeat-containing protein [Acuticoccus sp.]